MSEKTENKNEKTILSKTNKIIILLLAIIFSVVSVFNLYLEFRKQTDRQTICYQMAIFNAQIPPSDINSYLMRKISFEKACTGQTGLSFGSYFWAFVSFVSLVYAINLFRQNTIHKKWCLKKGNQ